MVLVLRGMYGAGIRRLYGAGIKGDVWCRPALWHKEGICGAVWMQCERCA